LQAGEDDHLFLLWQIFQNQGYTEHGDNSSMKEDFSQQILHLKFQHELKLATTIFQEQGEVTDRVTYY
jgi:hypothetical protein